LTNLSLEAAADLMTQHDPSYSVRDDNGVIVIRPKVFVNNRDDFLNQPVKSCEMLDVDVVEALTMFHRYFDPTHRGLGGARRALEGNHRLKSARIQEIQGDLDRRFSVRLSNTTGRQILNEIVKAHGAIWWSVSYRGPAPSYHSAMIRFNGFNNWSIGDAAR
jgi:hypothetical protein